MQHMTLKAATNVATDQGTFTAVISAASVDREKDIVDPNGMVRALKKWVPTGKMIPLAWNHSGAPADQIGSIDPATAESVGGEVVVKGQMDLSTENGAHAWRLVKAGTLGFSFGYLALAGTKRKGGGRNITELDVFEITATPTPMNNDTRVIGYKGAEPAEGEPLTAEELAGDDETVVSDEDAKALRRRADEIALEHAVGGNVEPGDPIDPFDAKAETDAPDAEGLKWLFPADELEQARLGEIKAVWTTAAINELPDSAFLYIAPGGDKDSEGKTTPRSLRHFPYKGPDGQVDLPHLRNALARIPQADLPQDVKDAATAKAQRILDAQKSVSTDKGPSVRSSDPLRDKALAVELEFLSCGESLRKPPRKTVVEPPKPEHTDSELREWARREMLVALSGVKDE